METITIRGSKHNVTRCGNWTGLIDMLNGNWQELEKEGVIIYFRIDAVDGHKFIVGYRDLLANDVSYKYDNILYTTLK